MIACSKIYTIYASILSLISKQGIINDKRISNFVAKNLKKINLFLSKLVEIDLKNETNYDNLTILLNDNSTLINLLIEWLSEYIDKLSDKELYELLINKNFAKSFSIFSHPIIYLRFFHQLISILDKIEIKLNAYDPRIVVFLKYTFIEPNFDFDYYLNYCKTQYYSLIQRQMISPDYEKNKYDFIINYYKLILLEHNQINDVNIRLFNNTSTYALENHSLTNQFSRYGNFVVCYKYINEKPIKNSIKFCFTTRIENKEFAFTLKEMIKNHKDFYEFLLKKFDLKPKSKKEENIHALFARNFIAKYFEPNFIDPFNIYKEISENQFEYKKVNKEFYRIIEFLFIENGKLE